MLIFSCFKIFLQPKRISSLFASTEAQYTIQSILLNVFFLQPIKNFHFTTSMYNAYTVDIHELHEYKRWNNLFKSRWILKSRQVNCWPTGNFFSKKSESFKMVHSESIWSQRIIFTSCAGFSLSKRYDFDMFEKWNTFFSLKVYIWMYKRLCEFTRYRKFRLTISVNKSSNISPVLMLIENPANGCFQVQIHNPLASTCD